MGRILHWATASFHDGWVNTPEFHFENLPGVILENEDYIFIPGLDAPIPRKPDEWEDWTITMLLQRERIAQECERDVEARRTQMKLCQQPHGLGAAYFAIMFAWIHEPRDDESTMVPMFLYPRQAELLFAIDHVMGIKHGPFASMATPKARAVGATWIFAVDRTHRWIFKKNFHGRIVSRTEDMVDSVGDPSSWMFKFDFIVARLPWWMVPEGYNTKRGSQYRTHMKMVNPVNGNTIIGEATTSGVGVGGRATCYDIDEAARFVGLRQVWGQLAETTNHRFAISTHNIEVSTDFWDLCHAKNSWPDVTVFDMPWWSVVTRDEAWLEESRNSMTSDMFEREVLMNPFAGISSWVYPTAKLIEPSGYEQFRLDYGLCYHALDDGYDDEFAIVWAQRDPKTGQIVVLDGYESSHKPISYYGHLLKGEAVGDFEWDSEALRIMRWINDNRTYRGLFVGDRHGANTDLTSGDSPWRKLERAFHIHVQTNPHEANGFKERRDALSELLSNGLRFADTPGAVRVLEALQNNKFPTRKNSSQPTQELRRPVHDGTSHFTTALEYLAVHIGFRNKPSGTAAPKRSTNNGWLASKSRQKPKGRRNSPDRYREVPVSW